MVNVGVIGLGVMGKTHLDAYALVADAKVVAVADVDPEKLAGRGADDGNIEGQGQGGFDPSSVNTYTDGMELIRDNSVELVDICLATPLHARFAVAALEADKHVLIEKPLARTSDQAGQILDAAKKSKGLAMCAQCMRFWPGWTWLKDAVENQTYGRVLSAVFRRVGEHPGGAFYEDGEQSGGAILDLHIHDTDFVQHLFGVPKAVTSTGYSKITGQIDHITTFYHYESGPHVVAEGGWVMAKGYGFKMTYCVNFEQATAAFDFSKKDKPLTLCEPGQDPISVELEPGLGYFGEIAYLIDCIQTGRQPKRVTLRDAAQSLLIIEAEEKSVKTGRSQTVRTLA